LTSLWSLAQSHLAGRPQSASSSHELLFPTAHQESKVHLPRAQPARSVPSSGFGYPRGGLLPSVPCRFCFAPAALLGFTLRSISLPKGTADVSVRVDPRTVQPASTPDPPERIGPAQTGPGFWGLTLSGVPCERRGFSSPATGCSHGVRPSRAHHRGPCPGFARTPLSRFATVRITPHHRRRPRVSLSSRPALPKLTYRSTRAGRGDPLRVRAPARSRAFGRQFPGLCVHLALSRHRCRHTSDPWGTSSPYRSCRDRLRCRAAFQVLRSVPATLSFPALPFTA
jgi:hypothetical protein